MTVNQETNIIIEINLQRIFSKLNDDESLFFGRLRRDKSK